MQPFRAPAALGIKPTLARPAIAAVLAALSLAGCRTGEASGPTSEVRDSAGVAIVLNSGEVGPDGGGWAVDPEPVLSIGTFAGDSLYQLFRVQGAARLPDGRIAVANGGSGEIRVYDARRGIPPDPRPKG